MSTIPVIGISGSIEHSEGKQFVARDYFSAILAAGGIPVLLSMDMQDDRLDECLRHLDGVLLAGGDDVAPRSYDTSPQQGLGPVDPLRDQFELRLTHACYRAKMPVLGICRGIQVMNVAMGGTLYQDIALQYQGDDHPAPMLHQQTALHRYPSHSILIDQHTMLFDLLNETTLDVNSLHHQAIRQLASSLRVCAVAPDGVIEAVDDVSHPFFLGVQWHPENMYRDDENAFELFLALTRSAAEYARQKA